VFIRRGKPVTMVRDAETKRFIRGIRGIQVAVSVLFEYPPEEARRSNPIYVDVKAASFVMGKDIQKMRQIEDQLYGKCRDIVNEMFGEYIRRLASDMPPEHYDGVPPRDKMEIETCIGREVGVEYIAVPIDEAYPDFHYWVVWHHYRDDCKEEDGVGTIQYPV